MPSYVVMLRVNKYSSLNTLLLTGFTTTTVLSATANDAFGAVMHGRLVVWITVLSMVGRYDVDTVVQQCHASGSHGSRYDVWVKRWGSDGVWVSAKREKCRRFWYPDEPKAGVKL